MGSSSGQIPGLIEVGVSCEVRSAAKYDLHNVRGAESNLFCFSKVIGWVAI